MLLSGCASEQHAGDAADGAQSLLHQDKKAQTTMFSQRAIHERRLKPPDQILACPRCQSLNTKFCYYNNYSLTQPRHFCKNCRRYWTAGGTLRNVPVGGGCRKNKRTKQRTSDLSSVLTSVESSGSGVRTDGGSSTLHASFNSGSASSSAGYFDQQFDLDPTKIALRQSVRGGPSGVNPSRESGIPSNGHVSAFSGVTHGSQPAGLGHSAQSSYEPPGIVALGFYSPQTLPQQVKAEVTGLVSGDLSSIFENSQAQAHCFRGAPSSAPGGGSALGEEALPYQLSLDHLSGSIDSTDVNVHWRLQAATAHKQPHHVGLWGTLDGSHGTQDRGGEVRPSLHHIDDKGLMDSLRNSKGKSVLLSSSSSADEAEPVSTRGLISAASRIWQPVSDSFETVTHDSSFWSNQNWPPLNDMHSSLSGNPGNNGTSNNNSTSTSGGGGVAPAAPCNNNNNQLL